MDIIKFKTDGEHLFPEFLILIFYSPLFLFSYVFDNFWGFWKNIFLINSMRNNNARLLTTFGLRLMILPICIDMLISIPLLIVYTESIGFTIIFYASATIFLILMAFLWSLVLPKKITSAFARKGSTSPWANFAAMGGVLALSTIRINNWFYALLPLVLVAAIIGFWLSFDLYKYKKYDVYQKVIR